MVKERKAGPRLPIQQLTILAICRFAEPVAMTSVYPYIPEMVQSFNVPTDKVARWAGLMSACFSLSQALLGIAWGRASDRFGRKPMILSALTCTMISSVMFGFSTSLPMAFVLRSMQGLSSGNVGIIRTAVAELVPQRELQPRAFSIMPLVWSVGSIFGPGIGGSLVYPVKRYPAIFGHSQLLERYPFALPNLLISAFFLIGITSGILFLRESLEDKKERRDYGLVLGSLMTRSCTKRKQQVWSNRDERRLSEEEPFLSQDSDERHNVAEALATPRKRSSSFVKPKTASTANWSQVFTRQSNLNLIVYAFLAMHSVAYDQLLPIFMHHPTEDLANNPEVKLPFRFTSGFSLSSPQIGFLFTIYGTVGMIIQFFIFPPLTRRYGSLNCYKVCAVMFPLIYICTPFMALFRTNLARQVAIMCLMLVKCFCVIFAFPCSTILLTNSAASLKVLGTLNGVATTVSAVGRAAGPAMGGALFSLGVDHGYVILPWWTLAAVAAAGAIPAWWLIEMEGFGGGAGTDSDEDDEDLIPDDPLDSSDNTTNDTQALLISGARDGVYTSRRSSMAAATGAVVSGSNGDNAVSEDMSNLSQTMSRGSQSTKPGSRKRKESFSMRKLPPQ